MKALTPIPVLVAFFALVFAAAPVATAQHRGGSAEAGRRENPPAPTVERRNDERRADERRFDGRFDDRRHDERRFDDRRQDERRFGDRRFDERFEMRRFGRDRGHFEWVTRRVWHEGYTQCVDVPAEYVTRYDHCGRPYTVCIRPAHVEHVQVPGWYETVTERVWVNEYTTSRCGF